MISRKRWQASYTRRRSLASIAAERRGRAQVDHPTWRRIGRRPVSRRQRQALASAPPLCLALARRDSARARVNEHRAQQNLPFAAAYYSHDKEDTLSPPAYWERESVPHCKRNTCFGKSYQTGVACTLCTIIGCVQFCVQTAL